AMSPTLTKALLAFVPVLALLSYSIVACIKRRTGPTFLQLLGSGCLLVVVLTHVAEALHLFPIMRFGEPDSAGHYVDLASAAAGIALLPIGFVLNRRDTVVHRRSTG